MIKAAELAEFQRGNKTTKLVGVRSLLLAYFGSVKQSHFGYDFLTDISDNNDNKHTMITLDGVPDLICSGSLVIKPQPLVQLPSSELQLSIVDKQVLWFCEG